MSEIIPLDECPHPELTIARDVMRMETTYHCVQCRKKLAIPDHTLISQPWDATEHIILITFGPRWSDWIHNHLTYPPRY